MASGTFGVVAAHLVEAACGALEGNGETVKAPIARVVALTMRDSLSAIAVSCGVSDQAQPTPRDCQSLRRAGARSRQCNRGR